MTALQAAAFRKIDCSMQTDKSRWSHDLSWTLESGPDDAPSSIDIEVPYDYSGGIGPSWTSYGGDPGDPAEVGTGTAWYVEDGALIEITLLQHELDRVELYILENPPELDYLEDW